MVFDLVCVVLPKANEIDEWSKQNTNSYSNEFANYDKKLG